MHLLGMALGDGSHTLTVGRENDENGHWFVAQDDYLPGPFGHGPTLAEAIAALLRDLGREVPERPEDFFVMTVNAATSDVSDMAWMKDRLRDRYANPATRLAVLTLLEDPARSDGQEGS